VTATASSAISVLAIFCQISPEHLADRAMDTVRCLSPRGSSAPACPLTSDHCAVVVAVPRSLQSFLKESILQASRLPSSGVLTSAMFSSNSYLGENAMGASGHVLVGCSTESSLAGKSGLMQNLSISFNDDCIDPRTPPFQGANNRYERQERMLVADTMRDEQASILTKTCIVTSVHQRLVQKELVFVVSGTGAVPTTVFLSDDENNILFSVHTAKLRSARGSSIPGIHIITPLIPRGARTVPVLVLRIGNDTETMSPRRATTRSPRRHRSHSMSTTESATRTPSPQMLLPSPDEHPEESVYEQDAQERIELPVEDLFGAVHNSRADDGILNYSVVYDEPAMVDDFTSLLSTRPAMETYSDDCPQSAFPLF
jgi:hypothetical protein